MFATMESEGSSLDDDVLWVAPAPWTAPPMDGPCGRPPPQFIIKGHSSRKVDEFDVVEKMQDVVEKKTQQCLH